MVRVHSDMLARQKFPDKLVTKNIWKERFKDIRALERHLARNGVAVLKLFLHISKEEQRRRLLTRLDEPAKRWKFSLGDIAERKLWDKYMAAYEDMIRATSQPEAPWYVVPRRPQMVCTAVGRGSDDRGIGGARSAISQDRGRSA